MQEPRRPAKLPPPPRAELLKQQQEEEERRRAAAAAKLAYIERRIAARREAEAQAAAEAAAAEAAAQEQAAATAAEAGVPEEVPETSKPAEQEVTAAPSEQPAKPAVPLPEQAAPPPNAWVKPLTLANGVLDAEHAAPAVTAAAPAATPAEDVGVLADSQMPAAPQASEPALISLTSEVLPAGDEPAAAAAAGSVAEPVDAQRGQRPQRGRGRARAERPYDPEQADRRVTTVFTVASSLTRHRA